MSYAGLQGRLGTVVILAIVIVLVIVIAFLVFGGYFASPPKSHSVFNVNSNANAYLNQTITVHGYYENGVITDVPTNNTYQVNNWNPSNVFLPVNLTNISTPVYIGQSYYFTGILHSLHDIRTYPLATVILDVQTVRLA